MDLRLCERLNQKFITHNVLPKATKPQEAKAWNTIEKLLLSLSKEASSPKQLWVSICFAESIPIITLSNAYQEETDLTIQGVKNIIPKAQNQGLKVEVDPLFKEITFTFTPSNY